MDHTHHMPDAAAFAAPEWLIASVGILFLGFCRFLSLSPLPPHHGQKRHRLF